MADGMTIQRSSREALRQGFSLRWLLDELQAMQRDGLLPHKRNSADRKFNGKGLLVDGFEKPGSKLTMDGNSRCND
jgi:hypothetical protein